jgi:hypothetical protein
VALASAAAEDQARAIAVVHGPASDGQFEPWVDYREADWIGLDADGSGGAAVAQRVASITLEETEAGGFGVELELNSVEMDAFLRLQRRLDALSRDTTASGSGGASGNGGGAGGRVGASSSDTPGYLLDKLDVAGGLTKQLAGDVGAQRVRLAINAPALGTGTPDGTKFLRDDGVWAAPPGGSDRLLAAALVAGTAPSTVNPDPASPTQVPGMAVTFTLAATKTVVIRFRADFTSTGGGSRFSVTDNGTKVYPEWGSEMGWTVPSGDGAAFLWVEGNCVRSLASGTHTILVRESASGSTAGKTYYSRTLEIWDLTHV